MVDYNTTLFQNPPEVWDAKKCAKAAKHHHRDGLGTRMDCPGLIGHDSDPYGYGEHHYNGGCVRDGAWWQGENKPLPRIHEDFELYHVLSWGWFIRRKQCPPSK